MTLSYFDYKHALKHQIKELDAQQAHYEALKIKTIARNKKAHDICNDPKFQKPTTHPLYEEAQQIIQTARTMQNQAAELIPYIDECIKEIILSRTSLVLKLSTLIA